MWTGTDDCELLGQAECTSYKHMKIPDQALFCVAIFDFEVQIMLSLPLKRLCSRPM